MSPNNNDYDEQPILSLIQQIKDGTLNPKILSIDSRKECVKIMKGEGYTNPQIAQIFQITDRQIRRDVKQIREDNPLTPSIEFAKQTVGDVVIKALAHHDYFVRLSNSKDCSSAEKIQSRVAAWQVLKGLVEKLQSLGYLPLKPQEILGDLFYHIDEQNLEKSFQDVRKSLSDVIDVAQQCGTLTPELQENVDSLRQRVEKAQITQEVEKLLKSSNELKEENHDQ